MRIWASGLLALTLVACTTSGPSPSTATTGPPVTSTPPPMPVVTSFLGNGVPLPSLCSHRNAKADETVAFAAADHVWTLDPATFDIACVLDSASPEPFLWGPLGDRVLMGGFQVAGVLKSSPSLAATGVEPAVAAWGHPIGIAIVYSGNKVAKPQKLFLETGDVETLTDLPAARYLDVAYHPSGLALAFILERNGSQSIWFSSNEGKEAKRMVFTKEGTTFTDLSFSPDGGSLEYVAEHAEGYPEFHSIDLTQPDTLLSRWRGDVGQYVRSFSQAPSGNGLAVNLGKTCNDSVASILDGAKTDHVALPDEDRPTTALGWLDSRRVLVGADGCNGDPMDLYAVDFHKGSASQPLVTGVDTAASRTPAPRAPDSLPKEVELDTGSGIG
jgi:hypothetical protein